MSTTPPSTSRDIHDGPFAWLNKEALRRLAEGYGESDGNALASARSVYLALVTLASDAQAERFQAAKSLIAHRAGVSVRTVATVLKRLEKLSLICVERQSTSGAGVPDAASFYTVLSVGNSCLPAGNRCRPRRQSEQNGSFADKVEESGTKKEKSGKKGGYANVF